MVLVRVAGGVVTMVDGTEVEQGQDGDEFASPPVSQDGHPYGDDDDRQRQARED